MPRGSAWQPVEPSASAGRLVAAAARMLPPADQERYAREFASELWDLAAQGASRAEQVKYAIHQLSRVTQLRNTALSPRSRSAAP